MDDQSTPIKFTPVKGSYYRSEGKDKPSGSPKSEKDFKRIYNSDDENEPDVDNTVDEKPEQRDVDTVALNDHRMGHTPETLKAAVPASPFALFAHVPAKAPELKKAPTTKQEAINLTKRETVDSEETAVNASQLSDAENVDQSPYQPVNKIISHADSSDIPPTKNIDKADKIVKFESNPETLATTIAPEQPQVPATPAKIVAVKPEDPRIFTEYKESKSDHFNNQFTREQPDLAYVNPLAVAMPQTPITTVEVKPETPNPSANLQALVEKLVKELSVVKQGDKTETTLVLDNPPQFKGMRIVITGFESANNEFNLKFENLTQAAQQLLDQQQNRADLLTNLERKGYNVHLFITTTYSESNPLTTNVDTPSREREREDNSDRGQSRERQKKGEQPA